MKTKLTARIRAIMGVTALAVVAAVIPVASQANALPPGTPAAGLADLVPATGNSGTGFQLSLPTGAACPGDGTAGYRWQTYITPISNDPADMTFTGLGQPNGEPAFSSAIRNPGGQFVVNQVPTLTDGFVIPPAAGLTFQAMAIPEGSYNIGIACTLNSGSIQNTRFWNNQITITSASGAGPQNFTWSEGVPTPAIPSAPVLQSPLTAGNGSLSGTFTATPSFPATSQYTITAAPQGGGSPITINQATAGAFTIPGLTNGTTYDVSVTATNAEGTSPASNVVSGTPAEPARPPVTNLQVTPGSAAGSLVVSFGAPASGPTPTDYTVAVTDGSTPVTGSPFTAAGGPGPFSQTVTGLTPGTVYTVVVTPNPNGTPSAPVTATVNAAQVLNQEITVERPAGALILTQRCGVNNLIDAWAPVDAFPGFPVGLDAEPATTDQVGTAPIDDDNAPALDTEFPEYPQPSNPTYPTTCGVDLGTAQLVTTGALAGQYYTADGVLNEITVLDTRPENPGWSVTGNLDDQFTKTGDNFDGNYLGWDPQVGSTTPGQTVTAGAPVLPGTGVADATPGLADGRTLASAAATAGNGIAQLDARLMLLIPVAADAGVYNATLTFTAV